MMMTACQLSNSFSGDDDEKLNNRDTQNQKKRRISSETRKGEDERLLSLRGVSFCVSGLAGLVRLARGSEARRPSVQPSDTGGDTQPYFSWVFTRDLKVASASLRLKAFLDFPAFLHIRPCPFTRLAANCLMTASTV